MKSAVRLMNALTTHALAVLGAMDADEHTTDLVYLLDRASELPVGSTLRDLTRAVQGRRTVKGVKGVRTLLDELTERGCVRLIDQVRKKDKGREPSPIVELHPALRSDRIDRMTPPMVDDADRTDEDDEYELAEREALGKDDPLAAMSEVMR